MYATPHPVPCWFGFLRISNCGVRNNSMTSGSLIYYSTPLHLWFGSSSSVGGFSWFHPLSKIFMYIGVRGARRVRNSWFHVRMCVAILLASTCWHSSHNLLIQGHGSYWTPPLKLLKYVTSIWRALATPAFSLPFAPVSLPIKQ